MIDRNSNLSYLGCGTALWVGRQIDSYENLFYTNREAFEAKGADIRMETTVKKIDFEGKKIFCESLDGATFEESYDKLILATGSLPIAPQIPGSDLEGISFLKLFQDGDVYKRQVYPYTGYLGILLFICVIVYVVKGKAGRNEK